MNAEVAARILVKVPMGENVIVKNHWTGKKTNKTGTLLACSVPASTKLPKGWYLAKNQQYEEPGKIRVQFMVEREAADAHA